MIILTLWQNPLRRKKNFDGPKKTDRSGQGEKELKEINKEGKPEKKKGWEGGMKPGGSEQQHI